MQKKYRVYKMFRSINVLRLCDFKVLHEGKGFPLLMCDILAVMCVDKHLLRSKADRRRENNVCKI